MKSILNFILILCWIFIAQPAWARFIVFKSRSTYSFCVMGVEQQNKKQIPIANDGSFQLSMAVGAELIILDTRIKKTDQYGSWKIKVKNNTARSCVNLTINTTGVPVNSPGFNAFQVTFDGYKGYLVIGGGGKKKTPEAPPSPPSPPGNPKRPIGPIDLPKKAKEN